MNIYKVERIGPADWDEFRGMVVSAASEDAARLLHPALYWRLSDGEVLDCIKESPEEFEWESKRYQPAWVLLKDVHTLRVTLVGTSHTPSTTVVLADYKSG
ncbi:hypothetical protein pEaSNUABM37_00229 [Erwinia phage pEa_SNUABM_37]|nr:hypothetical protein pEaSNUABM37_00229 [Erwinia phage pEa_SNUABM_37]QXO10697.1 hypothetical protein pEaSNUABM48_00229 [Erwinia phage pEa_SNUABM_48]